MTPTTAAKTADGRTAARAGASARWLLLCAGLAACASGLACRGGAAPPEGRRLVRVAAAADLKFAFDELIGRFGREHPDIDVRATYGSSGTFFAQLSNEAPFDLYFSADMDYPRRLVEAGLADPDSLFPYAVGRIVVWVPAASPIDVEALGIEALLHPAAGKVAIANPRHAPYGAAAEAAMASLGVIDRVRDRLVLGENVAQAAQFVQGGGADVGVIALSLAMVSALMGAGKYWLVPSEAHPALEQGGVLLGWAGDRGAAEAFLAFVGGPGGRAVLDRYGFRLPGG